MKRIYQLDSLRFILIITIVVSHLYYFKTSNFGYFYSKYLNNPTLGVDYFFMLSGFGVFLSNSHNSCNDKITIKKSIFGAYKRIDKIYPIYCISLILGLIYSMIISVNNNGLCIAIIKNVINSIFCLTLTQSLTGMTTFSHAINSVCWFISALLICYIFAPLFQKIIQKAKISSFLKICITILALLISSVVAFYIDQQKFFSGYLNDLWYGSPIVRCWYFILGMEAAEVYLMQKYKFKTFQEFLIICISAFFFVTRNSIFTTIDRNVLRAIDVIVCFMVLLVFSNGYGKFSNFLTKKTIVNLGKYSVYIYLLHYPIIMLVDLLFGKLKLFSILGVNLLLFETLIILILISGTVYLMKKNETQITNTYQNVKMILINYLKLLMKVKKC